MSFQQGLSGLNASSKNLEVIGNNVANANTSGFKQSRAEFANLFANSITGSGENNVGIGVTVANVAQQFTQGNITTTTNALDIAINGNGFFRMDEGGTITYTRNGQFSLDKDGYIVNGNKKLTGYSVDANGAVVAGAVSDIKINSGDLAPKATTTVKSQLNFDSRDTVPTTSTFSPTDSTSYNDSTAVTVVDTMGTSHTLQYYFAKTSTAGQWEVYTTLDGTETSGTTPPTAVSTLQFTAAGTTPTSTPSPATVAVTMTNGASNLSIALDFSTSTQYGASFSPNTQTQDGYTSGRLASFSTSSDGTIVGRYTNGQSAILGQVVLAKFANPNGLQPLSNNSWAENLAESGPAVVGAPGSGTFGVLQSSALEDSNVDLTTELVNMITAQRMYQANSQTIKTQDQVLQTLVNLR